MGDFARRILVLAALATAATAILWLWSGRGPGYSLFAFLAGRAPEARVAEVYTLPEQPALAAADVPILERLNAEFTRVATAVVPSVVSVDTLETVLMPSLMPGFYQKVHRPGLGSGVIVTPQGHVVTNHHVIANKDASKIRVTRTSPDGRRESYPAEVIGSLPAYDIAVLRILGGRGDFPALKFGESKDVRPGQMVFAVGNPYGLSETVTQGIISAIQRRLPDSGPSYFLQTDTPINPGNSGGPLVNHRGEIIGINSAIYGGARSGVNAQNIGFAIPSNQALAAFQAITGRGRPLTGYLGLVLDEIDPRAAAAAGLPAAARVQIREVRPASPAARAGLRPLDVLLEMNGRAPASSEAFLETLRATPPGTPIELAVWRGGEILRLAATVGDAREVSEAVTAAAPADNSRLEGLARLQAIGIRCGPAGESGGLRVETVAPGSLADGKIRPGEQILAVNGKPVASPAEFHRALLESQPGQAITLRVSDGLQPRDLVLAP
jgi:serine protease Do